MSESIRERLLQVLQQPAQTLAVAVSGGVDSLTLMALAARVRPGRCVAVHARSPAVPEEATARVKALAAERAWRLRIIRAGEFSDPDYLSNPLDRCYYCKTNLFQAMASANPGALLATGTNTDDLGDFRPGLRAGRHFEHDARLRARGDQIGGRHGEKQHGCRHPYRMDHLM